MDLIQLIFSGKQRFFGYELKEDTTEAPNVHFFVVVPVSHEAFGGAVPSSGDVVGVWGRGVFSFAGAEVGQFDEVAFDEDVFGFDVAVEDAFAVHEFDGPEDLEHVELDFLVGERVLLVFEAFVHVHVHEFEDQCQLAYLRRCIPLGSSYSASIIFIMFSCVDRILSAWISLSFLTFSRLSNFFFMHLIATYLPVLSDRAVNTTEKVPLPFSN